MVNWLSPEDKFLVFHLNPCSKAVSHLTVGSLQFHFSSSSHDIFFLKCSFKNTYYVRHNDSICFWKKSKRLGWCLCLCEQQWLSNPAPRRPKMELQGEKHKRGGKSDEDGKWSTNGYPSTFLKFILGEQEECAFKSPEMWSADGSWLSLGEQASPSLARLVHH